jgi:lysophospholipase L1-like esterase
MANRIQNRRDTAANWTAANPVLSAGEPGLETDTKKRKTGDGTTAWASLPYEPNNTDIAATYPSKALAKRKLSRRDAPRSVFQPIYPLRVTTDAPTITTTDSTVGGASAAFNGLPQIAPADTRLTYHGCIQGARTFSGTVTMMNVSNGHYSASDMYPTAVPNAFEVEFDFTGTILRLAELAVTGAAVPYQMFVDGEAIAASPTNTAAVSATVVRYHTYTWGALRKRRIRFQFPANFALVAFAPGDTHYSFSAVPKERFSVFVLGDSWAEGTGATTPLSTFPQIMRLLTGWEIYSGGQGGTAYGVKPADGSTTNTTVFGSPQRIRAIAESQPDLVIFAGTSNNDATAPADLTTYAAQAYADAKVAAPNATIIAVGPQNTTNAPSGSRIAARDAIKAAADAAGVPFIDPLALNWITGTGTVSAPGTAGNASIFSGGATGSDAAHLNQNGYDYWAAKVVAEVVKTLDAATL